MVFEAVTTEDIKKVFHHLLKLALEKDDVVAAKVVLERVLGKPEINVKIDDARESRVRAAVQAMKTEQLEALAGLSDN